MFGIGYYMALLIVVIMSSRNYHITLIYKFYFWNLYFYFLIY